MTASHVSNAHGKCDFERASAAQTVKPMRSTSASSQMVIRKMFASSQEESPDSQELVYAFAGPNVTSLRFFLPTQVRTPGRVHRQLKRHWCVQTHHTPASCRRVVERQPRPSLLQARRPSQPAPSRCPETATPAAAGFTPAPRFTGLTLLPSMTHTQENRGEGLYASEAGQRQREAPFEEQIPEISSRFAKRAGGGVAPQGKKLGPLWCMGKVPTSRNPLLHAGPPPEKKERQPGRGVWDQDPVKWKWTWIDGCATRWLPCRHTPTPDRPICRPLRSYFGGGGPKRCSQPS